jgi:hypothetical protein
MRISICERDCCSIGFSDSRMSFTSSSLRASIAAVQRCTGSAPSSCVAIFAQSASNSLPFGFMKRVMKAFRLPNVRSRCAAVWLASNSAPACISASACSSTSFTASLASFSACSAESESCFFMSSIKTRKSSSIDTRAIFAQRSK